MKRRQNDTEVLRPLAAKYAEIAARPVQEERRELWSSHHGLASTRVPILVNFGWHNTWVKEYFGSQLECADPFFRNIELGLRMRIFHDLVGDDFIFEPWITAPCAFKVSYGIFGEAFGLRREVTGTHDDGGAWKATGPLASWDDVARLTAPGHRLDVEKTRENVERLTEAIGDIVTVDAGRHPGFHTFGSDISTTVAGLRGLEQVMIDMCSSPAELHRLLAFMRDAILEEHRQAEEAGSFSLTTQSNQSMPYAKELPRPTPNAGGRKRSELWGFCAAQEMTLISPQFHNEFIFQYQKSIYQHFGLVHYGCCEDLTKKIDMLRALPNLRSIAVAPAADVRACAEQIGPDYSISYRPNPTDMVCADWDEERIRRIISRDLDYCKGRYVHISLKDIETVRGDPGRLARWVSIVRSLIE